MTTDSAVAETTAPTFLPPMYEVGPCRRGCGKTIGKAPGPRARHENRCKGQSVDAPAPTTEAKKPRRRRFTRKPKALPTPSANAPNGNGLPTEMLAQARVLRDSAEKQMKQAARLEEMAEEVSSFRS